MDIGFTEEQELLRANARRFLENESPSAFVRQRMVEPAAVTDVFWQKLAEQDWFGILYPEEAGGSGLGLVDMTVRMEEMGRAVMPGPFFSTVLRGGAAIIETGALGCGRHRGGRPRDSRRVRPVRHQTLRARHGSERCAGRRRAHRRRQPDGQRRQPVPGDEGHSRPHRHLTREHDLQLYFEPSDASVVALGDVIWHRARAVRLLAA
jgi:hypothetical protein